MSKRIRHALTLVARALWSTVLWLTAAGKPWKKRPRSAFTRIALTTIALIAAFYYGTPYVQITQVAVFFGVVILILVCWPEGGEEVEEIFVVRPDEDLEIILTIKYTEMGPRGYFDDPLNPAYTHIVTLDKHIPDIGESAA